MTTETSVLETPEEAAYEARAAEGAMWTGGRLLIAIMAFAFAALAFTYFYLRSANQDHLWRPSGVTAPTAIGAAIMAFTLAAAALLYYGTQRLRRSALLDWEVAGWSALLAGLMALGLQCWEFTNLSFSPGSSGYASVFIGWSVMNVGLLFSGIYWTETQLTRHVRLRRARSQEGSTGSAVAISRLARINLVSMAQYWVFIGMVGLFFWVFLYVNV